MYASSAGILGRMISKTLYDDRFMKSKKSTPVVDVQESWAQWSLRMGGFVLQGLLVVIAIGLGTKLTNYLIEKASIRFLPRIGLAREDEEQEKSWEDKHVYDEMVGRQGNTAEERAGKKE